jgi:hypothetical protein
MKTLLAILFVISLSFAARAQVQLVPIVEAQSGGLMGGTENGKYLDAKTTFARLKGEQKFSLFGITGRTGDLTATVEAPTPDEPCEDFYYAKTGFDGETGTAIGAGLTWNPVPRKPSAINQNDKTYLKIVADILRAKGVPPSKAKIEQAVRIDLDGDGRDEVLLTASSYGGNIEPRANANDYSFVLLRKIVGGKAKNIIIIEEYVKKKIQFGAPNRFEISSIADLNGDGKMEIVLYSEYYEGNSAFAYELKGDKLVDIKSLGTGCGV